MPTSQELGSPTGRQVEIGRQSKSAKGTVTIGADKGYLRLRWTYLGNRHTLTLGWPDTKLNRMAAQPKAHQIEFDILSGNLDPSLKKYKSEKQKLASRPSVVEVFKRFAQERARGLLGRSQEKYQAAANHLEAFFEDKPADFVGMSIAEMFADWLKQQVSPLTARQRLILIKACWDWAITKHLVEPFNPWKDIVRAVKVPPKQMPKPFSKEEIGAIIQAFRSDRYYHHYADYVEFLFRTGCRTGEAIGLRWKHLSENCSSVWIGESLSRGVRKATKTNRARTIALTAKLQAMLLARRPASWDPDGLVFTSTKGGAIDDHNFRNRAWKTVITYLEIDYRKPYITRHTLISHALDLGMNPVSVAQLTGHDVQTLYEDYAGNVNSRPRLPEL